MAKPNTASQPDIEDRRWHAVPPDDALSALRTDRDAGLSGEEVEQRRQRFGANRLTPHARRTTFMRLVGQFNNLFIYLVIAAAVVTAVLGEWLDNGVIVGVALHSCAHGAAIHRRSSHLLAGAVFATAPQEVCRHVNNH
jgi:magnesium-transporting ATPase (P-type)